MAINPFDRIRAKIGDKERSAQWFAAQVKSLGTISTNQLLKQGKLTNTVLPGFMYLFSYDPKLKKQLSFYDRFPLVLPFKKIPDGFLGINFHYLPYNERITMLKYMHDYSTDDNLDERTKLRLNWNLIESSSRMKPVKACVKHYLTNHVVSKFLIIPYNDWVIASQLPLDKFVGAAKERVWNITEKKYQ